MKFFGLKPGPDARRAVYPKFIPDLAIAHTLPSKLDYLWHYPKVDNQGPFGTCVAFGTGKVFEFFHSKRKNDDTIISKRAIFSQAKHKFWPNDLTDDGLQVSDGLEILKENYVLESDFPYITSDFSFCVTPVPDNIKHTDFVIKGFVSVNTTVFEMRMALHAHGPLAIGANWLATWMDINSAGQMPSTGGVIGGHCVAIIGYDDNFENLDGSKGAFMLINNWDIVWGKAGFGWLPYNAVSNVTDAFTIAA